MENSDPAVSALVVNAAAAVALDGLVGRLDDLTGNDLPAFGAILDLLAKSPKVAHDGELLGYVSALQVVFGRLWEAIEEAAL